MADASWTVPSGDGAAVEQIDYRSEYIAHLLRDPAAATRATSGMRIVDRLRQRRDDDGRAARCSSELGFDARCIGCEPDGRNINLGCGSTAPELLARTVVEGGYRMGIAYDGDGDRAIFVDAAGTRRRRRRRDADVREADEGRGPAEGQRHRRDGDEQHRPGDRAARGRHRPGALRRSATST